MGIVRQAVRTKEPYLKMDYHFFPNVEVEMCLELPGQEAVEGFMDLDWDFEVNVGQDENRKEAYSIRMQLSTANQEKKAYKVKLTALGFFHFTDECPEEQRESMIYVLGQNMLYGACREYLYTMTAHGPHPALYLPGVTFVPDNNGEEEEVEALEE
nr:protein-export chaperone SecB [uncultured Pseudodesulfovibrio sp.]